MKSEAQTINIVDMKQKVMNYYNLGGVKQVKFLGESDNVTFRIDTLEGKTYVLKIHKTSLSKIMIESEFLWLEELATERTIKVQRPVKNTLGEWTTTVVNATTGEHAYWTLQDWLEGETLDRQPTEDELKKLAQLMRKLHKHAANWKTPQKFERLSYDSDNLVNSLQQLERLITLGLMTREDFHVIDDTVKKIVVLLTTLEKQPETWGVIHADLHESNYIFHAGEPYPIDFSSCGFGFYLYDIAETLLHLVPDNRKKFVRYYGQDHWLPDHHPKLLEAFLIWAIIGNFAFLSRDEAEHEGLSRAFPMLVEKYCKKFLKNDRFMLVE
ncbi:phosphotransferase enzyme family protein [Evansella sp. AB-rgal1]|uniref:phosphotransferase enzyme family protein n=1 Tax=Evansella sp. AB-rgal1 TaxID=3242696 RepID=UPI00359E31B2